MAEKKSTTGKAIPKKRTIKKVEEPKSVSEVQPAVEQVKPREINWDVIGLSSAAVTLVGTGVLFMIGWSYISNWYSFFGISLENINIPIQQILAYSASPLISTLTDLGFGFFFYLIIQTARGYQFRLLSSSDRFNVIVIAIVFRLINLYQSWRTISSAYPSDVSLPDEVWYLLIILIGLVMVLILTPVYVWIIAFIRNLVVRTNLDNPDPSRRYTPQIDFSEWFRMDSLKWIIIGIITFVTLMSDSATDAIRDARYGAKGFAGHVQKVLLMSAKPVSALHDVELSCDTEMNCVYGPFGLVAESANSFYLVSWMSIKQDVFSPYQGLYIVPRADQNGPYFIVPTTPKSLN